MRSNFIAVLSLLLGLLLFGCDSSIAPSGPKNEPVPPKIEETSPGMEGYVVAKQEGRILVVENVSKNYGSLGGNPEFYNAIWFSNAGKDAAIGDKVQVWFTLVKESYPGQSSAEKLRIVTNPKPHQADLTEAEAIRQALASLQLNNHMVIVIKAASYDESLDQWTISIKQGDETTDIQINDK